MNCHANSTVPVDISPLFDTCSINHRSIGASEDPSASGPFGTQPVVECVSVCVPGHNTTHFATCQFGERR
jgi:hypothetical protein